MHNYEVPLGSKNKLWIGLNLCAKDSFNKLRPVWGWPCSLSNWWHSFVINVFFPFKSQMSENSGKRVELPERSVMVPPFELSIGGLKCYSRYRVRIRCNNEVGPSPYSNWVDFQTPEAGISFVGTFPSAFLLPIMPFISLGPYRDCVIIFTVQSSVQESHRLFYIPQAA